MSEQTHVYTVYDGFNGLRIERAEVEKVTAKTVMVKATGGRSIGPAAFDYRTRIPLDEAHWSAEDAVAAFVAKKEREIQRYKNSIQALRSQLGQLPHLLKTFEAAEKG